MLYGIVILLNIVLKGFCRNLNCRVLVDKGNRIQSYESYSTLSDTMLYKFCILDPFSFVGARG